MCLGGEGGIRTPEALIRTCTLSRGVHSTSLPLLRGNPCRRQARSKRIACGMFLFLPSGRISEICRPSNIRSESIACRNGKSKKVLKKKLKQPFRRSRREAMPKCQLPKGKAADAQTSTASKMGGAVGRIRTHDPLVRSQILYPTELLPRQKCRSRILRKFHGKGKGFVEKYRKYGIGVFWES